MKLYVADNDGECFVLKDFQTIYSHNGKGYALYRAIAEKESSSETYFVKFAKYQNMADFKLIQQSFAKESNFKIRYPYITYVETCKECILMVDLEKEEKTNLELMKCQQYLEYKLENGKNYVLCLFEELISGMDLRQYYEASSNSFFNKEIMFRHMRQLICGMCNYMSRSIGNEHDRLIHRDIKPDNIRVTQDKSMIKYIDYDWAHIVGSVSTRYQDCVIGGTFGYMDPRQADLNYKKSDPQSDIYSLAMVFLYMMIGQDYLKTVLIEKGLSEYNNNFNIYLKPENKELLYKLQRNVLKRNGKPIFWDKKYESLIKIISKMMAEVPARYREPEDLLKDFELFLKQYYGEKYNEKFQDNIQLLARPDGKIYHIVCDKESGSKIGRNILQIANNQVVEIKNPDKKDAVVILCSMFNDIVYYDALNIKSDILNIHTPVEIKIDGDIWCLELKNIGGGD